LCSSTSRDDAGGRFRLWSRRSGVRVPLVTPPLTRQCRAGSLQPARLLRFVCSPLALVGAVVAFISSPLALVGEVVAFISDPLALVGEVVTFISGPLALVGVVLGPVQGRGPLGQPGLGRLQGLLGFPG